MLKLVHHQFKNEVLKNKKEEGKEKKEGQTKQIHNWQNVNKKLYLSKNTVRI